VHREYGLLRNGDGSGQGRWRPRWYHLVDSKIKDAVLHALYQKAGLDTMGQGIAFSLPVDEVVGLTPWKAEEKDAKAVDKPAKKADAT